MAKNIPKKRTGPRKARRRSGALTWILVVGVAALVVYGVSQMSNVAYTDADIGVVDFSSLNRREKNSALEAANRARCTCGCGMTLAQCVATDSTCPVREGNITRIRVMVEQAKQPAPRP